MHTQQPVKPANLIADSIFGTEQNYELLEQCGIKNYMKFPAFYNEHKKSYQNNPFIKEHFTYDAPTDTFTCPNQRRLILKSTFTKTHKRTGYVSAIKEYACESCTGCPFYEKCCKSTQGGNRTIQVNEKLEHYKQQARINLQSEQGTVLRKQRSIEIESCFGDIKHNMGFRRFHLRGLKKVSTEITLVAIAHNLRKMHLKQHKKAA
jgi:hypothetical protein